MDTNTNKAADAVEVVVEAVEVVQGKRWSVKKVSLYAALGLVTIGAAVGVAYLVTRKNNAVVAAAVEQLADVVGDATTDVVDAVVEAV